MLKKIDKFINNVYEELDYIKYLTPTNFEEENARFIVNYMKGVKYNPCYKYSIDLKQKNTFKKILNDIFLYKSFLIDKKNSIEKIMFDCLTELEFSINLYCSIGHNDFTKNSLVLYGLPQKQLYGKAINIINNTDNTFTSCKNNEIFRKNLTSDQLKKLLSKEIDKIGLKWEIIENKHQTSKVTVEPVYKKVFINSNTLYSLNDLQRLKVHEFGVHILRAENGDAQPYKVFRNGLSKSLSTEEGLATNMEEKFNTLDSNTLRLYAGRVIGTFLSLKYSFYEVFDAISKYFSIDDTMYIVSRIKRGISDTCQKGGFTKDYVYLQGYYNVKEYLKNNSLDLLYVGAVGIENIQDVETLLKEGILTYPKFTIDAIL